MPSLIAALLGALISGAGTLVGRVLLSLGIAYVSYSGIDTLVSFAKTNALQNLTQLPILAFQIVGVLQVGTCINILTSAFIARLVIRGLTSGALTRLVQR